MRYLSEAARAGVMRVAAPERRLAGDVSVGHPAASLLAKGCKEGSHYGLIALTSVCNNAGLAL